MQVDYAATISPEISIVIPVKNGIDTLPECLKAIENQTVYDRCEVIIIDSGSTDGTINFLKHQQVKMVEIDPKSFNHGGTRNLGVQHSKGEFVVMTVQDAVAADEFWLERLLRHFKNPEVAGVCGQQIVPHDKDKNPHQWFRPHSAPSIKEVQFKDTREFEKLPPVEQKNLCRWDNVVAMYRKKSLQEVPFQPLMFGEDAMWAKEALLNKYKIIYDSSARVKHYHHDFPSYTYRRILAVWFVTYTNFGFVRENSVSFKSYLLVVYRNIKWKLHPKWIIHNWKILWYKAKAIEDINRSIKAGNLKYIEEQLFSSVPQGKQAKVPYQKQKNSK